MLGMVQTLQQTSAEAARELLGADPVLAARVGAAAAPAMGPAVVDASTAGYRAPFRWDGDILRLVDQRRLPESLVDIEVTGASEAINAMNDGALLGASVQAQVAAATLAVIAGRTSQSKPFARRATIRGAANAFRLNRPGSGPMAAALDRMLALLDELGLEIPGDAVAAEFRAEAERIIAEAVEDHGALVAHAIALMPGDPGSPLHLLVPGSTGAMGGGQFGTALSVPMTMHHEGRQVHVLVPEGRPFFEGSRIAAWELRQAGVPHAVLTDAAAPGCIANDEVRVVLIGADRIAANGDVIATAGTYALALSAMASGIPFLVCATTNAVDSNVAEGADATIEEGRPTMILRAMGQRVAPDGSVVRNPLQDLVPAALVTAFALETGPVAAPFDAGLAAAVARATARRSSSRGFAALVTARTAAAEGTPGTEPAPAAVDVAALRNRSTYVPPAQPASAPAGTPAGAPVAQAPAGAPAGQSPVEQASEAGAG